MRNFPLNKDELKKIIKKYPTPFYLYDENEIIERVKRFQDAFKWNEGFKEHYAIKALPTPAILRLLKSLGCGVDAASLAELVLSKRCGFKEDEVIYTSTQNQDIEYLEALNNKTIINLDALEQIDNLLDVINKNNLKMPEMMCFRYNPGKFSIDASYIGELKNSKFGMTYRQLLKAIEICKGLGVKHFGLHAMLAGNSLDEDYYPLLSKEIFNVAVKIKKELDIDIEFIDLAGGLGVDYRNGKEINIERIGERIKKIYEDVLVKNGLKPRLMSECARYLTGPCGYLITTIIGQKNTYKNYLGIDASMADLMRPGMYNAYHHIEVLNDNVEILRYDVVGSLCENNDKFAINRELHKAEIGDILIIFDTGAHSRSMGFNYNGRLRCGELLYTKTKEIKQIRRKETLDDYFATFDIDEEFKK